MVSLTELPIEVVHLVFEYMDLVEICTCRLVSKWFNEMVKAFRVFELSFYSDDWFRKTWWYNDYKPVLPFNSLSSSKVSFLSNPSVDLRFLKHLSYADVKESDKFRLELLNSFQWLEQLKLKFEEPDWWQEERVKSLRLTQLKHLFISFKFQIFIELDLPKLNTLALAYSPDNEPMYVDQLLGSIHFAHPEIVRRLDLFDDLNTTKEFSIPWSLKGVEHLQCDLTASTHLQMRTILEKFSHLKVFEVWMDEEDLYDGETIFEEEDCEILNQIMQQKEKLKPSLRVYFCDVELSSQKPAENYAFDRVSKLASLVQNYSSLVYSHSLTLVDYGELLRLTLGRYQTLKLFNATEIVKVSEHIDHPDRFLNFLLDCPNLVLLTLKNSSLNTEFYRKLPAYTSLLELNIDEDQDLELDFKFLLKIKNLTCFTTNQNLGLDIVRGMAQLKFVNFFRFKIRNLQFEIEKNNGKFQLNRINNGYADLIEYCHDVPKLADLLEYFEKFADDSAD